MCKWCWKVFSVIEEDFVNGNNVHCGSIFPNRRSFPILCSYTYIYILSHLGNNAFWDQNTTALDLWLHIFICDFACINCTCASYTKARCAHEHWKCKFSSVQNVQLVSLHFTLELENIRSQWKFEWIDVHGVVHVQTTKGLQVLEFQVSDEIWICFSSRSWTSIQEVP